MRVLLELNGKRVDIKDPISLRQQKGDETIIKLRKMIDEALTVIEGN